MIKKRRGLALITAVMMIVFVSIAVLGLTTFIVQWFLQLNADQVNSKCLYLAQAGIHDAIYKVRSTYNPPTTYGSFTTGLTTVDTGETYRRGGTAADFLMVNTSAVSLSSPDILGIRLQRATSSALPAVTIASMVVSWTRVSGTARNLTSIRINGVTVWTGSSASPANVNITDVVLNTANIPITRLRWSGTISATTNLTSVTIRFVMLDGSSKTVLVFPASNNCLFTINSTGKVSGSNIYRTIKADYNLMPTTYATTSRIDNINEINTEITSP